MASMYGQDTDIYACLGTTTSSNNPLGSTNGSMIVTPRTSPRSAPQEVTHSFHRGSVGAEPASPFKNTFRLSDGPDSERDRDATKSRTDTANMEEDDDQGIFLRSAGEESSDMFRGIQGFGDTTNSGGMEWSNQGRSGGNEWATSMGMSGELGGSFGLSRNLSTYLGGSIGANVVENLQSLGASGESTGFTAVFTPTGLEVLDGSNNMKYNDFCEQGASSSSRSLPDKHDQNGPKSVSAQSSNGQKSYASFLGCPAPDPSLSKNFPSKVQAPPSSVLAISMMPKSNSERTRSSTNPSIVVDPLKEKSQLSTPWMVKAKYEKINLSLMPSAANDGVVMSQTRREWISKLNGSKGSIKGQIVVGGMVEDAAGHGVVRSLIVCQPNEGKTPRISPLLRVDVRFLAFGKEVEGIDPLPNHSVRRSAPVSIKLRSATDLESPVCAVEWLTANELLVASGKNLAIINVGKDSLRIRTKLPSMHDDDLRDIQLSQFYRNMCISGGYDGKVFITDCERVVSDQLSTRKHSQNAVYKTYDTVSSVSWNPSISQFASVTTDTGFFHCFDTRMSPNDKQTIVIETPQNDLYTHGWSDGNAVVLGYGDGTLRVCDIRKPGKIVVEFRDPHINQCGDIAFDPQRRFMVTFGRPGFSVWRSDTEFLSLWHNDPQFYSDIQISSDQHYKNSGSFMVTGGRQHGIFGTTDAHGYFSIYDVTKQGEAALEISGD